jgi:hypothetical protein
MTAHAALSPSARYRWGACPASVKACASYASKSSAAADDGTKTHALLEHCISNKVRPTMLVGTKLFHNGETIIVERDRAARATVAYDYVTEKAEGCDMVMVELPLDPEPFVGRKDMFGTADVLIVSANQSHIEVIDYKDGFNPVQADAPQLMQYAIGALAKFPTTARITTTVIQPKLAIQGLPTISSVTHEAVDLLTGELQKLIAEGAAVDAPDAPFVPGQKQCSFCPHAGNCAAHTTFTLGSAGIKFKDMTVTTDAADKEPSTMTDPELCEIIEAAPMLRKMIEGAEEEALRRITSGHPVPGLKAVKGPGRRQWIEEEKAIAAKLTRMGVPKGSVWKTSLVSPAQVANIKWEKRDGTVRTLSPRQLSTIENEWIGKSEGRLTVTVEADRRPSVTFEKVQDLFSDIGQEAPPATEESPSWLT